MVTGSSADQVSAEQTLVEEELLHVFYAGIQNGLLSGLVYGGVPVESARRIAAHSASLSYRNPLQREDCLGAIRQALDCARTGHDHPHPSEPA